METSNKKVLIWDWSTRVFHWLFAGSITLALGISLIVGEHSALFEWHMLFGISAGFLLVVRLLLFVIGSKSVTVVGLVSSLRGAPAYVKSLLSGSSSHNGSHNPLAWGVYLAMFLLLVGSIWTGINMESEWAEDLHEVFAYGLLALIGAHLAGLLFHTLRYKENIALSMLTGKKNAAETERIRSARPILGGLILLVCVTFIGQLFAAYQPGAGQVRVPWIGQVVALGENEAGKGSEYGTYDDDDDEDDHYERQHD